MGMHGPVLLAANRVLFCLLQTFCQVHNNYTIESVFVCRYLCLFLSTVLLQLADSSASWHCLSVRWLCCAVLQDAGAVVDLHSVSGWLKLAQLVRLC